VQHRHGRETCATRPGFVSTGMFAQQHNKVHKHFNLQCISLHTKCLLGTPDGSRTHTRSGRPTLCALMCASRVCKEAGWRLPAASQGLLRLGSTRCFCRDLSDCAAYLEHPTRTQGVRRARACCPAAVQKQPRSRQASDGLQGVPARELQAKPRGHDGFAQGCGIHAFGQLANCLAVHGHHLRGHNAAVTCKCRRRSLPKQACSVMNTLNLSSRTFGNRATRLCEGTPAGRHPLQG